MAKKVRTSLATERVAKARTALRGRKSASAPDGRVRPADEKPAALKAWAEDDELRGVVDRSVANAIRDGII
jgi:hypothetical protein